ncbi:MAG: hypothetical protein E7254_08585 [Lachnospiraceae bacterium]|nr:hypothetical protein [Lachnospiraceae bacterium]
MNGIKKRILSFVMAVTMIGGLLSGAPAMINADITTSGNSNDFPIVSGSTTATLWVDSSEETPVKRVVNDFRDDVKRVTGKTPTISNSSSLPSGPVVIIGTLDKSAQIKSLISSGKITSSEVNAIKNKWEAYLIKVVDKNTMVIAGSDNRGAIFGTYEVSEQMGVSPWYYFADVPIQTKSNVYMPQGTSIIDMPDVKYRGIFINDEEKLGAWCVNVFNPANGGSGKMGAALYGKIFELILRLKGNYIWPGMHVNAFDNIAENAQTIGQYGVVMRKTISAGDEWGTFKNKYAAQMGISASSLTYDYTVNPDAVKAFWRDSINKHKDSEVQWLFGMRGTGDEPFNTANLSDSKWDKYGTTTEGRKAGLLSEIIAEQLKMLKEVVGTEKANKACKAILPYKEVLQLYNNEQFTLPSDMTVIWCDDNHGMVRRTPTNRDRAMAEGGMYYHASYWAPANQSYMWMSSIPLSVIGEEMSKCWDTGIRKIWVLNVGDIKPAEGEMDYFIRCGWDVDKYTKDSAGFSKEWMKRNFGSTISEATKNEIADILTTFYHHSNIRKTEHMRLDLFDQTYFNEWDERMEMWQNLYDRANAVSNSMSSTAMKTAFYELVQCKINWVYLTNKMFYYADKSTLAYDQGRMASAQNFSDISIATEKQRKSEIAYYSTISNNKWKGLIDPEVYSPPVTSQLPETNPTLILGEASMGVVVQGEEMPVNKTSVLTFSRYGNGGKFIDIFNKGAGSISWSATCDQDFVSLTKTSGTVNDEQRIFVTINNYNKAAGKSAIITITSGDIVKKVKVNVSDLAAGITNCYVEANGYVAMEAEHYTAKNDVAGMSWKKLVNAGRGFSGDMMQVVDPSLTETGLSTVNSSTSPSMSYDFYLTSEGAFPLEIYRLPTMNAIPNGKIRFAYSVDNQSPVVISSTAVDEGTTSNQNKQWVKNLFGQIEKHVVTLPSLSSGKHTLKIWMVDNYIAIDKMVIYTDGVVKDSQNGPNESYNSAYKTTFKASTNPGSRESKKLSKKNVMTGWGSGPFVESAGKVGIEAEYAMENVLLSKSQITSDMAAYTVSKKNIASEVSGKLPNEWRLTQSDTGLAMRMPDKGSGWSTASQFPQYAPELSYRINFSTTGTYNVWLRWRYVDNASDSIRGGLDNTYVEGQFSGGGGFHTDSKDEKWYWQKVATLDVATAKQHLFSLWVREDGNMVDKIYLTTGSETPTDSSFTLSSRVGTAAKTTFAQTIAARKTAFDSTSYPLGTDLGCYDKAAYNWYKEVLEQAEVMAYGGNVTDASAEAMLAKLDNAEKALKDSQVLDGVFSHYNAYRDFERDELSKTPYGFDVMALTNGAQAVVAEENDNKFLRLTTSSTAGKANLSLPFNGTVFSDATHRVEIEFDARFTGTFQYANAAMIRNNMDKYAMVVAFDNTNQAADIKIQNAGTKTSVQKFESGKWYKFKLIGNCSGSTYSAYINDELVADNFTFRDATGSNLVGHLVGIDGFANGMMDYDNFSVKVIDTNEVNNAETMKSKVATMQSEFFSVSYPLGDTVGCYKTQMYVNLLGAFTTASTEAKKGTLSEDKAEELETLIAQAKKELDGSLVTVGNNKQVYNLYRDFEHDVLGNHFPYGVKAVTVDNGGATTIVEENGNRFLRLSTGDQAGHVNLFYPYVGNTEVNGDKKIVVEYSARINDVRYANLNIAKNQSDSAATTMAFDNASSAHRVILKQSGSSTQKIADYDYNVWNSYKAVLDMDTKTYDVYMNDVLVAEGYPFRTNNTTSLIGHSFGIDGFANGQLDLDNLKVYVMDEQSGDDVEVSDGIEINGYQISPISEGMRTVYSVADEIDGKAVVSSGIVYSLSDYAKASELYVGSDNDTVVSFESTQAGRLSRNYSKTGKTSSFAMTMLFATKNPAEYTANWRIRAYAKLEDGSYAYSDSFEYTIFDVAEKLYNQQLMPSQSKHDYLYTDILSLVNSSYVKKEFNLSKSIVELD